MIQGYNTTRPHIHLSMKFRRFIKSILKRQSTLNPVPVRVTFDHLNQHIETLSHQTILDIANANDVDIAHYCGGCNRCGTCAVKIIDGVDNLSKAKGNEEMVLGVDKFQKGHRLACQARILGDVTIHIPDWF